MNLKHFHKDLSKLFVTIEQFIYAMKKMNYEMSNNDKEKLFKKYGEHILVKINNSNKPEAFILFVKNKIPEDDYLKICKLV